MDTVTVGMRRGKSREWDRGPMLAQGEFGLDIDSGEVKIGNGRDTFTELPVLMDTDDPPITRTMANKALSEFIQTLDPETTQMVAQQVAALVIAAVGTEIAEAIPIEIAKAPALQVTPPDGSLGFFGKVPASKPAPLTPPANDSVPNVPGGPGVAAVLNNTRARLNELETRLKALGLLG